MRITLAPPPEPAALAAAWQALEARADGSFFQGWTWVGCRLAERFAEPVVLCVAQDGRLVGLALCNRARGRLWLGESGDPAWDAVYVEHNGVLLARGAGGALAECLRRLGRLRLSGVDAAHLAAARAAGAVRLRRSDVAPCVDLTRAFLLGLSANTRQQLRRSDRAYGPVTLQAAATLAEAEAFLAALAALHQARWAARGQPGAFANPAFVRFHRTLLARALPRGEAELLRISAGGGVVGYLYNFCYRGRVLAYQSGFDYAHAPRHGKPGLTCHHAAILRAQRAGLRCYDFLAGADRYKTSLANAATPLHWLDLAPRWSAHGLAYRLAGRLRPAGTG